MPGSRPRILCEEQVKSLTRLGERDDKGLGPARLLLKAWLLENSMTVNEFSMVVCMNRRVLDTLLRGEWRSKGGYIQLHQAFAIDWATKGEVPAWLWLDDPYVSKRIRDSRMSRVKDFELRAKRHVLKWNSLKTADGMLRERARVLSRLFNVQWTEVKRRAWLDATRAAADEKADIGYLMEPEDRGPSADGIYVNERDKELTDEEWFRRTTQEDR